VIYVLNTADHSFSEHKLNIYGTDVHVFVYVHASYPEPVNVPSSLRGHWQIAKRPKSLLKGYLCNSPDTLEIWRAICYLTTPWKMISLYSPNNLSWLHGTFLDEEFEVLTAVVIKLATCFMLDSFSVYSSNPEDGGDMFLRNVGLLSTDYTALYHIRHNSFLDQLTRKYDTA
jgi:hypothetical protein